MADVVLPASASWCEAEGTVTNSERRVQRVPQGARPARPGARRHRDHLRRSPAARPRLAATRSAEEIWNELRRLSPMPRRHELRAARGAGRYPVAVPRRGRSRPLVPARPAVGGAPAPGRRAPFTRRRARAAGRQALATSSRCASPPAGGWTRSTPACRPAATARRCAAASRSTFHPRTASASASPTANASGSPRGVARSPRRCASTTPSAPAWRS